MVVNDEKDTEREENFEAEREENAEAIENEKYAIAFSNAECSVAVAIEKGSVVTKSEDDAEVDNEEKGAVAVIAMKF